MVELALKNDDVATSESLIDRNSRAVLKYLARSTDGSDTEFDIRAALTVLSPPTYGSLVKTSVVVLGRVADTAEGEYWDCEVHYSNPNEKDQQKPQDESTVVLEIRAGGGSTVQRTHSIQLREEVASAAAYELATTSIETIMGLKASDGDDGSTFNAQGIPFREGKTKIIVHLWRSNATMMNGFLLNITDACNRHVINSTVFRGFPIGTLQLDEVNAIQKIGTTDAGWDISVSMDFERNLEPDEITIGDLPAFTQTKHGHDYLDILWMPKRFPIKNVVVSKPVRAAIHQVYDGLDYNALFNI